VKARGNLSGLRPNVVRQIEKLFDRRAGTSEFVDPWLAVALQDAALAAGRRVGVLADRRGVVRDVLVGDALAIELPKEVRLRVGPGRLGGVRLIHATFCDRGMGDEDLRTLRMASLDASIAVLAGEAGRMPLVSVAWLLPVNPDGRLWEVRPPAHPAAIRERFDETIHDIEAQMRRDSAAIRSLGFGGTGARDAAILVLPVFDRRTDAEWEMAELRSLCRTADVAVAASVIQRRDRPDPRTLIGRGKLHEVSMLGLQHSADLLIFGVALGPSQQRSIAQAAGVRVIDRNQLILDIFAAHARSIEGRLQVELAQLRYNLPRLVEKDDSLSRLTGGIGALGPGETKLEMERRRAKQRIHALGERAERIAADRSERRRRRTESDLPVVALVGYTNAGKSTIFNALTGADVRVEDRLFATLDPTTRRMRDGSRFLVSDTVGFIRELPKELVGAFLATLEEVRSARALVLVADASDPHVEEQIESVRRILGELEAGEIPTVLVLNKADRLGSPGEVERAAERFGAVTASALDPDSLRPVVSAVERILS
jgi:GTP-binding protein HflX